ncbi:putative protein kinase RLK-Pelle-L-LEC family [Helianthus annuus]|uniref:non-specific serine/threonine protein kinase n=1 Tax=Helianthus annuus TaxID=4232 RepID=A0A251V887_HELAN|nr:putative protein kinase RLK-Pelle-L-LEC family [Helianthus annuus]KAJ0592700.1 putative protein kinase RLK-Pelle-L-LEC family [Helianthus annuus]KAJ0607699.1 putative protein kinase RLK-Pelle-L-LEC family [Helianthus annuus]KAJ0767764.1 putative protein kinase RLK-Pelle-L-LEC family [Helianthus annuus]KAJ0943286.1 putative protein kinase RLK-Pelle-L-LEC family [Helianthus annuus]
MSEGYADGLTFFLAEDKYSINYGGAMGLPFDVAANESRYPFVAVEFDTYCNYEWDPRYPDRPDTCVGEHCTALIEYYSDSQNLRVSFTGFEEKSDVLESRLEYTIDLRDWLPEWVIFGFSASTGNGSEINNVRSWMFNSTELEVDQGNAFSPTASLQINEVKGKPKTGLIVGLIAGTAILVTVLAILAYLLWWRKKNNGVQIVKLGSSVKELGSSGKELGSATKKLGEGGFGEVYKGILKDSSTYIAVKRVSKNSKQGPKEYASEVKIISRLRHRNLVQLTGWCHENGELLVVYEFLENGSLDLHLFKGKSLLTWNTRYKIAHGLVSALLYLHEGWEQCVLHRDIKLSNVFLDSNFNAKLGDFGLAKLVDHENGTQTTTCAGTIGYMAPEYLVSDKASKESDVFSFGVVALEISCGRKAIDSNAQERKKSLVEWVWDLYGTGTLLEAADPRLNSDFSEEIKRLMIVGLWCAPLDSNLRPSMKQAIQVLNSDAPLPVLPSEMPKVTYSTSAPTSSSYGGTSSSIGSSKLF